MAESDQTKPAAAGTKPTGITRRSFVTTAAAAGAGVVIVPRHVLGRGFQAPSDTMNVAIVGIGGMGGSNARALMSQNIVAICDVDDAYTQKKFDEWKTTLSRQPSAGGGTQNAPKFTAAQTAANGRRPATNGLTDLRRFMDEQLPKVQRYKDYRQMLEKQKDLDGIVVATPDHMHAIIASSAMDIGKHVYVQKPLCWSVQEARHLAQKAKTSKVVTQMGNQGHSRDEARLGYEYITSGAIGEVKEVHVWTNRPLGYWPQGVPRPAPMPDGAQAWNGKGVETRLAAALGAGYHPPKELDWDLFLGVAPKVDYHPIYHPFNWRGWVDWGQGALGDMGAHLIDHPFWSLDLGMPTVIETIATPFNGVCYPNATTTYYEFPARGAKPAVRLTWYDGGLLPPRPDEMGEEKMNPTGGVLYVGSKGKMLQDTYGLNPRLLPKSLHDSTPPPANKLPRIAHEEHEMNWVEAVKGKAEISSPFEYAAKLTEVMLLGIASLRAGGKIHYDAANMKITAPANGSQFLSRQYPQGWNLSTL
ncbi:MAG: Gfo/Idh/MocA family oxidoreductase [Vicinamibacterales bacterium]